MIDTKRLMFIHMSDIHLSPVSGKNLFNMGIDTLKKCKAVFNDVRRRGLNPDFFMISGDLIHEGTVEDYRWLKQFLKQKSDEFAVPVFVCLGNHDEREAFWIGYKDAGVSDLRQSYYYSLMIKGFRLIVLDSKNDGREEGLINEEQLTWLRNELHEPSERGSIVILHHPLLCSPLSYMKYSILQNTDELISALAGSDACAILSGHIHFNANYQIEGIMNAVISAVSYGIDCSDPVLHKFMDDSTYGVVEAIDHEVLVEQYSMPSTKTIKYELPIDRKLL
ncbi:metallophosphoesterase [Sporolactobacillus shoreicorticis]|uniref:Metallophosphoesterase family protein n=1 Tax=Sporolactobacillus shoreicorticis TaxID=1923877 RepID=A0ABW5SAL0_9BACL|nr:metallophosphoesterase [Sporolactobacillus shoreicorticis]MCO7125492.1 metallophosphoesterase [Sporolactobacillus shoreicorticis]